MLIAEVRPAVSTDPRTLALGAALGAGLAAGALALTCSRVRLLSRIRDDFRLVLSLFRGASLPELALVAVLAGIGEEMLFRGLIQTWLTSALNPALAILITAALFGLAHAISRSYVAFAFLLGVVLGYLYYVTGSLAAVMVAHAVYDFVALTLGMRLFAAR
jgi:membrane protease YdiL (CAAX protease family)